MFNTEILAPAGGMESIYPAVRLGADAVYLGAEKLSARGGAENFDRRQLKEAVEYCHARGVKVHLACNTLLRDEELSQALDIIKYACKIHIDAIIVQDIGLASLIKSAAPDMPLHASTQMSVHTPAATELLYDMGFSRAVLARELSKKEIIEIAKVSPIELEVFVHGALCMSVSGQCYFSAMLGSRSGNRGLCAQTCRLPFDAGCGKGFDLSLKDMSHISYLRELRDIGIMSYKIEGRMKRPEYVAAAVAACRQSLDNGFVSEDIMQKLSAVFSRSGFTDGYYNGKLGEEMFGIRSKANVTSATNKVMSQLRTMYKDEAPRVPISFDISVKSGKPSKLCVKDNDGNSITVEGEVPQKAEKVALTDEKCKGYLKKTGGTPFGATDICCDIDSGIMLPAFALNALRRNALDELLKKRSISKPIGFNEITLPKANTRTQKTKISTRARFCDTNVPDSFLNCELIYVPLFAKDSELVSLMNRGFAVAAEIPRAMFGRESQIEKRLAEVKNLGINEVIASNIGAVALAQRLDMDIHGGFGLNIMNTASVEWAEDMGLLDIETSFELTLEQISKLGGNIPIGIISYGRLPLMLTRNCPAQNSAYGCRNCKNPPKLRDRMSKEFLIGCDKQSCEILNSVPLVLSDRQDEIKGVDFQVLRFSVENSVEKEENLQLFNKQEPPKSQFTRGLYYRGVE